MADVIMTDASRGEPSINVKSLLKRFENGAQEGATAEKHLDVGVATKASEGIKKFESLAKKDPGQKHNESNGHAINVLPSGRGSVRIGTLRHKFEALANRSLTSDLFNATGESDDESHLNDSSSNLKPVHDAPEQDSSPAIATNESAAEGLALDSSQGLNNEEKADSEPVEGEDDLAASSNNGGLPDSAVDAQGEPVAINEDNSQDMSTCSATSEDSINVSAPALCLKEEIENAEAHDLQSNIAIEDHGQVDIHKTESEERESVENSPPLLAKTIEGRRNSSPLLAKAVEGRRNSSPLLANTVEGRRNRSKSVIEEFSESPDVSGNSNITSTVTVQDETQGAVCDPSPENLPVENVPEVQDKVEEGVDTEHLENSSKDERIPIERSQPAPVKRGFFVRLFTCGTAVSP